MVQRLEIKSRRGEILRNYSMCAGTMDMYLSMYVHSHNTKENTDTHTCLVILSKVDVDKKGYQHIKVNNIHTYDIGLLNQPIRQDHITQCSKASQKKDQAHC